MNSICLMGRLTADPELKTTQSGVSVTSFTLAVDRGYTPKGQEKQVDFINCVAWRNTAEFISKFFRKGVRMAVKGELQQRSFTTKDGDKRTVHEVLVENAFFCESRNADVTYDKAPVSVDTDSNGFVEISCDEDLPF